MKAAELTSLYKHSSSWWHSNVQV